MSQQKFFQDQRYTRRSALAIAALGAATLAGLPGCGGGDSGGSSSAPVDVGEIDIDSFKGETLNLFTWASYHKQPWLAEYEKSRGVTINTQLYGGVPDGFAKVKANPDAFDIVMPTSGWIENYADADLIVPLDESNVPNMKNIIKALPWRDAAQYNDQLYGIIYSWGDQPLCWLPDQVDTLTSWRDLYDPSLEGKVSMVDDPTTQMPVIPIMLGFENPFDLDSKQMDEMRDALMDLRGQVTHVSASIEDQTADFANGQVTAGILYNISTFVALRDGGVTMEQVIPKEGTVVWTDNYAMTHAGEKKAALCYDFINYTLSIPWQARYEAQTSNSGVLSLQEAQSQQAKKAGMTQEALDATLIPFTADAEKFFSKMKVLQRVPNLDEWLDMWNEFKTGL